MKAGWSVLGACLFAAACNGSAGPVAPAQTGAPLSPKDPFSTGSLAGEYDLTIDIPENCAQAAAIMPTLAYRATFAATSFSYLSLRIGSAARGDLWPIGAGSVRINLNNFDSGGCDGEPERLADGRLFNICAEGLLGIDGSKISGTVEGSTWIAEGPSVNGRCSGAHRFTFLRRTP